MSPTPAGLAAVSGNSTTAKVYAVGNGTIIRWNNPGWSQVATPPVPLYGITMLGGNQSFAVGANRTVYQFNDQFNFWGNMTVGGPNNSTLYGVWTDGYTAYAVGENGTAIRYFAELNATTWHDVNTYRNATFRGVWGAHNSSVYAVGGLEANATITAFNGVSWGNVTSPSNGTLYGIWGLAAFDVLAVGAVQGANSSSGAARFKGGPWQEVFPWPTAATMRSVFGFNSTDIWSVGDNGTILHYDGNTWSVNRTGSLANATTLLTLNGIWGYRDANAYRLFAVGDNGTILEYLDGKPIISSYTVSPTAGVAPLAVTFTCVASDDNGIASYRWDVNGDGNVDFVSGPANNTLNYTYGAAGNFNSSCTVVDTALLSATAYAGVTVSAPANATSNPPTLISFVANPERGIAPLAVLFTFTATDDNGTVTYRLDVNNDGAPEYWTNATNSFSWTYNATGSYIANGTVYDAQNQTASAIRHITVTSGSAPTVSSLAATPLTGEMPLEVTFTVSAADADGDLSLYDFDFNGDGTYDRTVNATLASSTTYKYATAGTYSARARARDRAGNQATSSAVSITVRPAKVAGASNQSAAVSSVTVNTQDTFPMSSLSLINNYRISENNFTSLTDVREFTSAVVPATGVPATYCYKFSGVSQNIAELRLFKLTGGANIPFRYASTPSPDSDGAWWVTTEAGAYLSPAQSIAASDICQACFVIRDNGPYDLDSVLGSIRDPQVLGAVPAGGGGGGGVFGGGGGGGGGGCVLAPAAAPALDLALLLVPAAIALVRRKRR